MLEALEIRSYQIGTFRVVAQMTYKREVDIFYEALVADDNAGEVIFVRQVFTEQASSKDEAASNV